MDLYIIGAFMSLTEMEKRHVLSAFPVDHLPTLLQAFQIFKCCPDIVELMKEIDEERIQRRADLAVKLAGPKHKKNKKPRKAQRGWQEPGRLPFIVGLCRHCGGEVWGGHMPTCETKLTGRVFYKECSTCTYYAEIFKHGRNRYREEEGGTI